MREEWRRVQVMEEENLFIVIKYRKFLSDMYIPQQARSEVFDPSA